MKRTVGVTCVAVILFSSACSGRLQSQPGSTAVAGTVIAQITATAQLSALQTSVASTVVAQVMPSSTPPTMSAATREPTAIPEVTATPGPTASPTKMAMPTFELEMVIPSTWNSYEDPDARFSLRYPEDWAVTSAEGDKLAFQAGPFHVAVFYIMGQTLPIEGQDMMDQVEKMIKSVLTVPFETTGKGKWPGAVDAVYLSGVLTDPQTRFPADAVMLYARTEGGDVIAGLWGVTGVGSVERFDLDRLIGSIRYSDVVPEGSPIT